MARFGPKNNNKEKPLASQSCSGYLRNSEIGPFLSPDWVSLSVSKVREEFGGSWQRHSKGRKVRAWGTVEATGKLALSPQMLSAGMTEKALEGYRVQARAHLCMWKDQVQSLAPPIQSQKLYQDWLLSAAPWNPNLPSCATPP